GRFQCFEEWMGDVWVARRIHQGGQPVEPGEQSILTRARLYLARPADDAGHSEAALEHGSLRGPEWGHAAIRPREYLRTVIGREDDDGVVGLANIVKMLQKPADAIIQLRHCAIFQTVVRLAIQHGIVLFR